mmetsp:Transcript_40214/g.46857  ORF Transcript_40214/g.46857 Transcript_40214/m.46857 type:complete len:330 (-) Transcript_40214:114-1103(-)
MEGSVSLEYCQRIPKIELHAHLHGSIRKSTLIELLKDQNIPYDTSCLDTSDPRGSFKIFDLLHAAITSLDHLRRITREVLEDFAEQNTVYMELRTTPRAFKNSTIEEYVKVLVDEVDNFNREDRRMVARIILSINRAHDIEKAKETLSLAVKYKAISSSVVGLDFSGNAFVGHFKTFKEIFEEGRKNGLKVTIHTAENACDFTEEETNMILDFGPERVGHFNYFTDKQLETLLDKKIVVETCPTSNKFTMNLKDYEDHHFGKLIKAGTPVAISTDDTVILDTDISQEIYRVCRAFGMNEKEVKDAILSGITGIFDDSLVDKIDEMVRSF